MKYICIEHVTTSFFLRCVPPKPLLLSSSLPSKNIINEQDENYLKASMWCMFDGKTNQNMFYICATALLGYIIQQPGITNVCKLYIYNDKIVNNKNKLILIHIFIYIYRTNCLIFIKTSCHT